jgi:hypothetical protein
MFGKQKTKFLKYEFTLSSHQEEGVVSILHSGIYHEQTSQLYWDFYKNNYTHQTGKKKNTNTRCTLVNLGIEVCAKLYESNHKQWQIT